jgi:predicted Zn-dependent peptidase
MYKKDTLDNGLRLVTLPMENTSAVTVLILAGAGSRHEERKTNGIAHFLEHMFFKGGKKYPDTRAVSEAIDSVGGDFNAFTSKEFAGYYVKVASRHIDLAMDVLSDMLMEAKFEQKEVEKERGVIIEELNMYLDMPIYQVGNDYERLVFGDQPLGWDIIGTIDSLNNLNRDDFVKYKNDLYTPDNIVLTIAGGFDHNEVMKKVERYFPLKQEKKSHDFLGFNKEETGERVFLRKKETEQAHLILGVESYPTDHPDYYTLQAIATILGGNMSSRLFLSLREDKGLAYYVRTGNTEYVDIGEMSTSAGVDVTRIDLSIKTIIDEYERIRKEGVEEKELTKAKEYYKGKLILRIEDSKNLAQIIGLCELLLNRIETPDEIMEKIDKVTTDDIRRVSEDIFKKEKLKLSLISPNNDEKRFEKLLDI